MKHFPATIRTALAGLGLIVVFAGNGVAAVSAKDVLIIGRVIALIEHGPTGNVELAVVQGGDATATRADVANMLDAIGPGKTFGPMTLTAHPVRYDALAGSTARVVFVPAGMTPAELDVMFAAARERKLVTIATSNACLVAQKCAISITSEPAVDIRLSIAASAATDVSFGSTFRMIIKEVQ